MPEAWVGRAITMAAMVLVFYLLIIQPQRQEQKRHARVVAELKMGDRVITTGGMVGTVVGFKGEHFVELRLAKDVEILFRKGSIEDLLSDDILKTTDMSS